MMRTLSNLSQDEQDRLFYICLQRIRSKDISDLLAMLYLGDVTTEQINKACKGFKHPRHAIRALKGKGFELFLVLGVTGLLELMMARLLGW